MYRQQSKVSIVVELRSGKLVTCEISKKQLALLKKNRGLSFKDLYEGSSFAGISSEYCCFDGTQIVKWKKIEK